MANHMDYAKRKIRAVVDEETITLYQAFGPEIAIPALESQSLAGVDGFKLTRMCWFKPSWTFAMLMTKYGKVEARRSRILAFKVCHEGLWEILNVARVEDASSRGRTLARSISSKSVAVMWIPARGPMGERVGTEKTIHIGVSKDMLKQLVEDWIISIEDVTDRAHHHKLLVDQGNVDGARALCDAIGEQVLEIGDDEVERQIGLAAPMKVETKRKRKRNRNRNKKNKKPKNEDDSTEQ